MITTYSATTTHTQKPAMRTGVQDPSPKLLTFTLSPVTRLASKQWARIPCDAIYFLRPCVNIAPEVAAMPGEQEEAWPSRQRNKPHVVTET
jgi:hypothetical protein